MTTAEKLEALVARAVENGFYSFAEGIFGDPEFVVIGGSNPDQHLMVGGFKVHVKDWPPENAVSIERVLFNHDFARALFGEEPYYEYAEGDTHESFDGEKTEHDFQVTDVLALVNWQHRLQQAVISEDPIGYMYEAVFKS